MTDLTLLKQKIIDSGFRRDFIAEKAGMETHTLYRRLTGVGEFTASEILGLSKALNLKASERNAIFFKEERE